MNYLMIRVVVELNKGSLLVAAFMTSLSLRTFLSVQTIELLNINKPGYFLATFGALEN